MSGTDACIFLNVDLLYTPYGILVNWMKNDKNTNIPCSLYNEFAYSITPYSVTAFAHFNEIQEPSP